MSKQIPVTNNTKDTVYYGSVSIRPGMTEFVPEHLAPKNPAEKAGFDVAAALKGSVGDVTKRLPNYSIEQLKDMYVAEEASKTCRKTMLQAITDEMEGRALTEARNQLKAEFMEKSDDELAEVMLNADVAEDVKDIVQSIIDERAAAE